MQRWGSVGVLVSILYSLNGQVTIVLGLRVYFFGVVVVVVLAIMIRKRPSV